MKRPPDAVAEPSVQAAADLERVQGKVGAARAVLARLLQELVVAESRLSSSRAAQLLEANEQLVVTALRNRAEAEIAAQVLARVTHSAECDALTQLPNRVLLHDRFARAIAAARRDGGRLALLFLDVNNFKQVNDGLGHAAGDEVLKVVAHRLLATVRDADTVCRYGGDEFVILLRNVEHAEDAGRIAAKVVAALGAPSRVDDQVLRLTVSIGISVYPDDGDDVQTLLDRADAAMFQAKRQALGGIAFHGAMAPAAAVAPPATGLPHLPLARHAEAHRTQQLRHAQLCEANEQLVLAALSAQDLQAAAERVQQGQSEFMALMAAELGNPLAPIRLASAMLGRMRSHETLGPRAHSLVEAQARSMARLVAAMHSLPADGVPAFSVARDVVDLAGVVRAAAAACRPAMDARLQSFALQLPDAEVPVLGEPGRLEQIVRNLLDNASKHTPDHGHIGLTLGVQAGDAVLTVTDDGIGITVLALPDIFEPFAQDLQAIGCNGVGLGIGLTVVRTLAEAHGGSVHAQSAGTGCGSTFTVSLPLHQAAGPP